MIQMADNWIFVDVVSMQMFLIGLKSSGFVMGCFFFFFFFSPFLIFFFFWTIPGLEEIE